MRDKKHGGGFEGCSRFTPEQINGIETAGRVYCPDAKVESKRIRVIRYDGEVDYAIVFRVFFHETKVVETVSGDAFIRYGDQKHTLTDEEKREQAYEKGQGSLELEPCNLEYPGDFHMESVRRFTASVRKLKETEHEISDERILTNHKLGRVRNGEFVPNIACALLFANDPQLVVPGCMIKFLRYQGDREEVGERRNVVKEFEVSGRIPDQIVEIDSIIDSQTRTFRYLGRNNRFGFVPEYPKTAWYEAVVNACVHRSYSLRGMNIFVKMFDDRLVIESPGGFMPFVTPENIYDIHFRRNFFLMDAMHYLDFVKCENEGAKRIRAAMTDLNLPLPEFEQKQINTALVRVTLRNDLRNRIEWIDKDASDVVGEDVFDGLGLDERKVVNFLAEHKQINVTTTMQITSKKRWHAAKQLLDSMVASELLLYVSKFSRDSTSHYILRPKQNHPQPPAGRLP